MRILAKMGILTHISVLYKCNFSKSAKKKKRRRTHIGLLFEFQFEFLIINNSYVNIQRRNGFYTVQTVFSIPLPYP